MLNGSKCLLTESGEMAAIVLPQVLFIDVLQGLGSGLDISSRFHAAQNKQPETLKLIIHLNSIYHDIFKQFSTPDWTPGH